MSVNISQLTKIYGNQIAVNNISLEAKKGEIIGLLGPNGAGKSTTMKMITCFIPPTSGTIYVSDYEVSQNPMEVRKRVGYLPEHNPLYLDMYVHEYLHFIGKLHGLRGEGLKKRTTQMIEITGLSVEQNKKIGVLSKGYRQRVGLAQAMIHDPDVLILDEPTTGLDPNQIIEIRNLIKNIGSEKTIILSTHIMQEVQALCNKVVIINKGEIVANAGIAELNNLKSDSKTLIAEFQAPIDEHIVLKIEGVSSIKLLGNNKYQIHYADFDIRAKIFEACQQNSWVLIGMTQKESTIEDIFTQLTHISKLN